MRKKIFLLLCLAFCAAGCAGANRSIIKSPASADLAGSRAQPAELSGPADKDSLSLAVVPFSEKRGNLKNYGSVYSYLIPLAPYGTMRYERPDEARMFNTQNEFEFNMSENLLKILVDTVKKKPGLFKSVIVTPTPLESKADLILSGDLHSTLYEGKTYSYGISFLGPALWCLGLPAGSSHKKLGVKLFLRKADTAELIWSYDISKENTVIQGLYHNWGKNINSFALLMEAGVREAIEDLRDKLKDIPAKKLKAPEAPQAAPQALPEPVGPSETK